MANAARIDVEDTPTLIAGKESPADGPSSPVGGAGSYAIKNDGGADVDLGGEDVATGEGFVLADGEVAGFDLGPGDSLFAVTSTGTVELQVLRVNG